MTSIGAESARPRQAQSISSPWIPLIDRRVAGSIRAIIVPAFQSAGTLAGTLDSASAGLAGCRPGTATWIGGFDWAEPPRRERNVRPRGGPVETDDPVPT
jgi:hypothetical protein